MWKSYLTSAFRSLKNNRGFASINILGLALGLTAFLLIVFYVSDELSYDRFNKKADRIYRVNEDLKFGNNEVFYAVCMAPLAEALKEDFPEVENAVRIKNAPSLRVRKGNVTIREHKTAYADQSLFQVFTLPMMEGNAALALKDPNTVVITESTARKYFNSIQVVGRSILFDDHLNYKITGVIRDLPKNSHFNFDFFLSMSSLEESKENKWLRSNFNTYVLLKEGADVEKFEGALNSFLQRHSGAEVQAELKMTYSSFEKSGNYFRLNLTPLTDIHLTSSRTGELGPNSTVQYVYIFSAIALFILFIACVNFMNLATARSSNRAKEVGVRKVLGSSRSYLIAQFLTESVLVTFVSAVLAFALALFLMPLFNQLSGKEMVVSAQSFIWLAPLFIVLVALIGVSAGAYPAFFLSAFQPIQVLKGKISTGFKASGLRNFLVVFQFSISIFLIIGTLVIYKQLNYIQTKNLGYNRDQVVIVQNSYELNDQAKLFKEEVKRLPGVLNATLTGFLPTANWHNTSMFYKDASLDSKRSLFPETWGVDEDYIDALGMTMAAGRSFSKDMLTDSSGIIINESAVKFLDLKDPLNKTLYKSLGGERTESNTKSYHIIGVVKDFNFSSLRQNISPVVLFLDKNNGALSIRVKATDIKNLLSQIEQTWKSIAPNVPINISFMDQDFDATYRSEQRIGKLFVLFTTLAIIIACLGLFGLAAYAAEQRSKEIGIRKILGATVPVIVRMLSIDFLKLVVLAIVIASPLAWFLMYKWLQDFAYRVQIQWWIIAVAGTAALVIAFLTISFQSVRAALSNPVKSLRSE